MVLSDETLRKVSRVDTWLDETVLSNYYGLTQHWARVCKSSEEIGEVIRELIAWTGQNPRKGSDPSAYYRMLNELADCAWAAILAIQHFTKDGSETNKILEYGLQKVLGRVPMDGANQ